MAGFCGDDPFVRTQQAVNDHRIGLSATHQEEDLRLRRIAGNADLFFGTLAEFVSAIAGLGLQIGLYQALQKFGMSAHIIIVFKRKHSPPPCEYLFYTFCKKLQVLC